MVGPGHEVVVKRELIITVRIETLIKVFRWLTNKLRRRK